MRRLKTINYIKFGLFENRNELFKDLKIYNKRKKFLKEHGYSPVANWETYNWFIAVFKEILQHYKYDRNGTPIVIENYDYIENNEENEKVVDKKLDTMIDLLTQMDENTYSNPLDPEIVEKMETAKNEFFKLFSEYFYYLWD